MLSNHLILCCPLLLLPSILPSIRIFSNESAFGIRWPKYWSFSFSISPSNKYSGLISFHFSSVQFSLSVMSDSLQPHELQHTRPPCPSPAPGVNSGSLVVMPSNHLILCHPLLLLPSICSSIRIFSNESALHIRWSKYWNFGFSINPSNEYSGPISFRMDWLDLLSVQGTLKSLLQHQSSKASVLWHSAFFIVQLSHSYMTTGKAIVLTSQTIVGKVMSLVFKMLSRLVITFLPRSKHLLISWLQSSSTVILEPPRIKFVIVSIISPSTCHEVMRPDAIIFVF